MILRFGTRGSKLALWQTRHVIEKVKSSRPDIEITETIVKTLGDNVTNVPLFRVGGQGLFIKEIEEALLQNQVDIAVHSLKDVPHALGPGLTLGAISTREDPRDALLSKDGKKFAELPKNCTIGTSSLRRRSQLFALRKDVNFADLRGNLDTRLRKLAEGEFDAIILAAAGLTRLGWADRISEYFDVDTFIPAAGQGLLGLECRAQDLEAFKPIFDIIEDPAGRVQAEAERAFLAKLQGGCQVAMAVHARIKGASLEVRAFLGSPEGDNNLQAKRIGTLQEAAHLGDLVAEDLLSQGGAKIREEWNKKLCTNAKA